VRAPKKVSLNRTAQFLATGRRIGYSHVILCVIPGVYVHATTGRGVSLLLAEDDAVNFPARHGTRWRVRRNKKISNSINLSAQVGIKAQYYIGQRYSSAFGISALLSDKWKDSHALCSELIARIYAELGQEIVKRSPEQVLPVHLRRATENSEHWIDVTEQYESYFRGELTPTPPDTSNNDDVYRANYISTVSQIVDLAVGARQVAAGLRELAGLVNGVRTQEKFLSEEENGDLSEDMKLDWRFKDNFASVADQVWAIDSGLTVDKQAPTSSLPDLLWPLKGESTLPRIDWSGPIADVVKFVLSDREVVAPIISNVLAMPESIVGLLGTQARIPGAAASPNQVSHLAEHALNGLRLVEDGDGYAADLESLAQTLRDRFAGRPLLTKEALALFRSLGQQLQCRVALRDIREKLAALAAVTPDVAAFYSLYEELLPLALPVRLPGTA
jgi:hypothetical protein